MVRAYLISLAILLGCTAWGQLHPHMRHLSVQDGLPSSEVYAVHQDQQGFIWFATDNGLARYNGYEVEHFTVEDGLCDNTVFGIHEDLKGRMWFRTDRGCLSYYKQGQFYSLAMPDSAQEMLSARTISGLGFSNDTIYVSVVNDTVGWYLTEHGAFGNLPGKGYQGLRVMQLNNSMLIQRYRRASSNAKHHQIEPDARGFFVQVSGVIDDPMVRIADNSKGYHFMSSGTKLIKIHDDFTTEDIQLPSRVIWLCYQAKGLWVGCLTTGAFFFPNGNLSMAPTRYLSNYSVSSILVDVEGSIWFTTLESGVYNVSNPASFRLGQKEGLSENDLTIVTGSKHKVWTGSQGGTIDQISAEGISNFSFFDAGEATYEISSILPITDDSILVGTGEGFFTGNLPQFSQIHSQSYIRDLVTVDSNTWAINSNRLQEYGPQRQLQFNSRKKGYRFKGHALARFEDTLFIGTNSGLFALNLKDWSMVAPQGRDPLLRRRIVDLVIADSKLWVATKDQGLIIQDLRNGVITQLDMSQGLTENHCKAIFADGSVLWVATTAGLNRVTAQGDSYTIDQFNTQHGLISNDVRDVFVRNDTVWAATDLGLNMFLPDKLHLSTAPKLTLQSVNNLAIENRKSLELSYSNSSVTFSFLGISFRRTSDIIYEYKVEGLDDAWIQTTERSVRYPSLPPGEYVFKVRALGEDGSVSETLSYTVIVTPPYWETWWFRVTLVAVIGFLIWLFFRVRVLTYNRDVVRELMLAFLKRFQRKEYLVVEVDNGLAKIDPDEILYLTSSRNYVDIVTETNKYLVRSTLKGIHDKMMVKEDFLRIHRSHIVRVDKIDRFDSQMVMVKKEKLPIGRTYKEIPKVLRERLSILEELS